MDFGSLPGSVDFSDDHFVVRCRFAGDVRTELQGIPSLRYDDEQQAALLPRRYRSVSALLQIAKRRGWKLTPTAVAAKNELQEQDRYSEFRVEMVFGSSDQPLFKVRVDDDEFEARVGSIPGTEPDDGPRTYLVRADRVDTIETLRDIVDEVDYFFVDNASRRLLDDPVDSELAARDESPTELAARDESPTEEDHVDVSAEGSDSHLGRALDLFEGEEELREWSRAESAEIELPSLEGTLLPFQVAGVRYLCETRRAFLCDEMGLAKDAQALATIETLKAYPAIIMCPPVREKQWLHEARRWLPPSTSASILQDPTAPLPSSDLLIVNYELLNRSTQMLLARGVRAAVADQSHLLRSTKQQRTRAALAIAGAATDLRLCLSAKLQFDTPIDLIAQLRFLGRLDESFGSEFEFQDRYCRPRQDAERWRFGATRVQELEERLRATCMCRRERTQLAAQLPATLRRVQRIPSMEPESTDVAKEAQELLAQLTTTEPDEASRSEPGERPIGMLSFLERVLAADSRKIESVAAWIRDFLAKDEWIVVFVRYQSTLEILETMFAEALVVRDDQTCVQAGKTVSPFVAAQARLLFCQIGACSKALALVRGRHVAFAELDWNAAAFAQEEQLVRDSSGESTGVAWYLVGSAIEEAVIRGLRRRWELSGPGKANDLREILEQLAYRSETALPPLPPPSDPQSTNRTATRRR